jgi:hypothetical protein
MAYQRIPLPVEKLQGHTIYFVFDLPRVPNSEFRSERLPAGVRDLTAEGGPDGAPLGPNVVRLALPGTDVLQAKEALFDFFSEHERGTLVKVVLEPADGSQPIALEHPQDRCVTNAEEWQWRQLDPGETVVSQLLTAKQYMQQVDARLADDPALQTARTFYFVLDLESHDMLLTQRQLDGELGSSLVTNRKNSIALVTTRLFSRLKLRAAGQENMAPIPDALLGHVEKLSDIQLIAYQEEFGAPDLGAGQALDPAIELAIEQFASGQLRLQLDSKAWACQPSSGFYFYFGEFALLAAENLTDANKAEAWLRLARAYVRTQRVFAQTYPVAQGVEKNLDGYHACNFHAKRAGMKQADIDQLRQEYATLAAGELAHRATLNVTELLPQLAP